MHDYNLKSSSYLLTHALKHANRWLTAACNHRNGWGRHTKLIMVGGLCARVRVRKKKKLVSHIMLAAAQITFIGVD